MNGTNEQNPGAGRWGGEYTVVGGGFVVGYEPKGDNGEYLPVAVEVHTNRQLTDEEILPDVEKQIKMHSNELQKLLKWRRDRIEKRPYGNDELPRQHGSDVRPAVLWFAGVMEEQLRQNDHKPGWKNDTGHELFVQLLRNAAELNELLENGHPGSLDELYADELRRCANVANLAMMIADNDRAKSDGETQQKYTTEALLNASEGASEELRRAEEEIVRPSEEADGPEENEPMKWPHPSNRLHHAIGPLPVGAETRWPGWPRPDEETFEERMARIPTAGVYCPDHGAVSPRFTREGAECPSCGRKDLMLPGPTAHAINALFDQAPPDDPGEYRRWLRAKEEAEEKEFQDNVEGEVRAALAPIRRQDMLLVDALAAYAHEAWSWWVRDLFSKCRAVYVDPETPGNTMFRTNTYVIPPELTERLSRQMGTPYRDLPDDERNSNRDEARKMLDVIARHMGLKGEDR